MLIINAEGLILGRLASMVAKRLLEGEEISIVNAEKAIVSGSKEATFLRYKKWVDRGSREKGPHYPRRPDQIVARTIRGMLPYKKSRGKDAFTRLKVYIGIPDELVREPITTLENADMTRLSTIKYMALGELSRRLGSW
jgi:large subunit ribosomal protein L13